MKVVMQNGTGHTLNRREMDALVKMFPKSWSSTISKIALYHARESSLYTVYYPKQKTVGLFCPMDTPQTKQDAVNELLIAIVCIIDRGDLPRKMTKSRRQYYLDQAEDIISKFDETIHQ